MQRRSTGTHTHPSPPTNIFTFALSRWIAVHRHTMCHSAGHCVSLLLHTAKQSLVAARLMSRKHEYSQHGPGKVSSQAIHLCRMHSAECAATTTNRHKCVSQLMSGLWPKLKRGRRTRSHAPLLRTRTFTLSTHLIYLHRFSSSANTYNNYLHSLTCGTHAQCSRNALEQRPYHAFDLL